MYMYVCSRATCPAHRPILPAEFLYKIRHPYGIGQCIYGAVECLNYTVFNSCH